MVDDDDDDAEEEFLMLSEAAAGTGMVSSSLGDLERRRISGNGSWAAVAAAESMFGPVVAITVEGMSSISSRDDVWPSSEHSISRSGDKVLCRWVISVRPLTCRLLAVFKNVGNWQ